MGVFGDEVFAMTVMDGEKEIAFAHEDIGGAGEHLGVVAFAELGKQDADHAGALALEGAGHKAGPVVEFQGGGTDAFAGGLGDGAIGGVVEDEGDGGRAQLEVLGQHLEADRAARNRVVLGHGRG